MKYKAKRKYTYSVTGAYRHLKDWLFINNDFTHLEILPPTLDNISLMKEFGLTFVVKGFKNIYEFTKWDRIWSGFGIASTFLMSRSLGESFIKNALLSFMNGDPLPDSKEIGKELENNKFIDVKNDADERRIIEREYYFNKYQYYLHKIRREIMRLILLKHRVSNLALQE